MGIAFVVGQYVKYLLTKILLEAEVGRTMTVQKQVVYKHVSVINHI